MLLVPLVSQIQLGTNICRGFW